MKQITIALVGSLALAGCLGHTTIDPAMTWRDPAATSTHFDRVIAIFVTRDTALRRIAEDRFVASIPGGVPSYKVIPDSEITSSSRVRERIAEQKVDGAVIIRMVTAEQIPNMPLSIPYTSPYELWGSWSPSWALAYDPQYIPPTKTVSVEAGVYSVTGNRLVWAGHSPTVSPTSLNDIIDKVVDGMIAAMKRENLL
jgi:hypothetical protein